MKLTAKQTTTRTIADLYRALDRKQPVTITYTKANGEETVRTIEIYDIRTTKAGDITVRAMDRDSFDSRTFRVDRIRAYTLHRGTYQLDAPAASFEPTPVRVTVNTPDELICRELAREDRDYYSDLYDPAA